MKSTGGTVDNQQVLDTWSGYSELEIECQGSYNIAYKLTDEIENTVEDPSECCPAGDSCDKPNLPTCESNDQGNPTADDSNSDDTTDISNNDSDNSNIISDQVFLGTIFQGGRDGSETGYFANKEIVNVMFDNITMSTAMTVTGEWFLITRPLSRRHFKIAKTYPRSFFKDHRWTM